MSTIDPYGLLGASVASTLTQVKQAYYALSLLVHPDKGGSAADMVMVHKAYKYVIGQLSEVNRTTTLEDLEARFAIFCKEQEDETPLLSEINKNNVSHQLFHDAFRQGQCVEGAASFEAGYGTSMEPSQYSIYVPEDVRLAQQAHKSDRVMHVHVPFHTQIVSYIEPETSSTDTRLCFTETERSAGLEDYGTSRPFQMTDYRMAFTTTREPLPDLSEAVLHRTYEDLVQQHKSIPS